ncbi:hypothetical protein CsSME_00029032 [Camellia sinensis var. sinensis]
MEVRGVVKKKRRVRRSEEEPALKRRREVMAEETSVAKEAERGVVEEIPRRVVVPEVVDIASEGMEVVPVVVGIATEVAGATPGVQVEGGATGPELRRREQPQGGPAPQGGGVSLTTAIYHARAVAGRLEGEEGLARTGADRLVGIVEEAALRSTTRFNEVELLRGLCSAQMEVTTLAVALLRKAGAAKLKTDEARAQLVKLKKESASWESAHAGLQTVKVELENTRRQVVSLEFQLAGEQKRLDEAQKACAVVVERHDEAMSSNEELVR